MSAGNMYGRHGKVAPYTALSMMSALMKSHRDPNQRSEIPWTNIRPWRLKGRDFA